MNLESQDILVLLKIVAQGDANWIYSRLAKELCMKSSEIHAAMNRAYNAGLMMEKYETIMPDAKRLEEFIIYGIKYAFAAVRGEECFGMPTSYAAKPLSDQGMHGKFAFDNTHPPVWPDKNSKIIGIAFSPLYATAPDAARLDANLYELLALVDAIRGGRTRERNFAIKELKIRMTRYTNYNRLGSVQIINRRRQTG